MSTRKSLKSENILGENIKSLRKSLNLKQYKFAEKLGRSSGYISEVESGKKVPGSDFVFSIKREFGVNIDSLFGEVEMILDNSETQSADKKPTDSKEKPNDELLLEKNRTIGILTTLVEDLRADKKRLNETIDRLHGEIDELKKELDSKEKGKNSA